MHSIRAHYFSSNTDLDTQNPTVGSNESTRVIFSDSNFGYTRLCAASGHSYELTTTGSLPVMGDKLNDMVQEAYAYNDLSLPADLSDALWTYEDRYGKTSEEVYERWHKDPSLDDQVYNKWVRKYDEYKYATGDYTT